MSENRETSGDAGAILRSWKTPLNWIRRPVTAQC